LEGIIVQGTLDGKGVEAFITLWLLVLLNLLDKILAPAGLRGGHIQPFYVLLLLLDFRGSLWIRFSFLEFQEVLAGCQVLGHIKKVVYSLSTKAVLHLTCRSTF
jgi:hypothetical protein